MLQSNVNYGCMCIRDQRYGRNNPDYVRNEQKYVHYEHIMIVVFYKGSLNCKGRDTDRRLH